MTISIVDQPDAMVELHDEWAALAKVRRNPLHDFEWNYSCATTLHKDDALHLVVQRNNADGVTAIAPLVLTGRDSIEFLGASHLYEPCNLIYRDAEALLSLYKAVGQSRHIVRLDRIPVGNTDDEIVYPRTIQSGMWLRVASPGTPVLELSGQWNDYYHTLSSRRRYDHRRSIKKASACGVVEFQANSPTRESASDLLDIAIDVEDRSWKGKNGSSLKRNTALADFFRIYSTSAAARGVLRVFFQYIGDRPAAMALCVEQYDALWFLKIGYDEEFREYSPGILQLMNIIEYCFTNNIARIEHLGAFQHWLAPWTSHVRPHSTLVHYPVSLTGTRVMVGDITRKMSNQASRIVGAVRNWSS
jgi:CelD/BcsL family acetyltransferase involved in cellulose biosynthesis